jgi:hypothetical protein
VGTASYGVRNLSTTVSEMTAFEADEHQAFGCGKRAAISANLATAETWLAQNNTLDKKTLTYHRIKTIQALNIADHWQDELLMCNSQANPSFQVRLIQQNPENIPINFPNWVPQLVWKRNI